MGEPRRGAMIANSVPGCSNCSEPHFAFSAVYASIGLEERCVACKATFYFRLSLYRWAATVAEEMQIDCCKSGLGADYHLE